ncbi:hypothetical protein BGZ70_005345 [Mortierella alpina]|uniref:Velvet domain-containing protein n=1 Tax=Mortierella alpina TaxID=64518 RepID=A0A9P6J9G5_MORAP|nr:hypothetical protein BGZ70_005345 [Mortierella alpina]
MLRNSEDSLHIETDPADTEQLSIQGSKPQRQETPCSESRQHHVTIKLVQQPLHARMCGFGEKDRRPIDPPPIVQLILDDPHYNELKAPPKPVIPIKSRRGRKKKNSQKPMHPVMRDHHPTYSDGSTSSAPARTVSKGHDHHNHKEDTDDDHHPDDVYELDEDDDMDRRNGSEDDQCAETPSSPHSIARLRGRSDCSSVGQGSSTEPVEETSHRKHGRDDTHTLGGPDKLVDDQPQQPSEANELEATDRGEPHEWPRYIGGAAALQQDPLFVLHVSLWSEDGSEVRSMIATSGRSEPAKLTRILMGASVVSPILLNNERGEPGWYFSFPDLSVRTEGIYTLKFSLMRFASFDFSDQGGSHASLLIAETTSQPFTVFSAKKFPGMTESTELSKAFAKQGLKIPIRNDLRARKNADKDS